MSFSIASYIPHHHDLRGELLAGGVLDTRLYIVGSGGEVVAVPLVHKLANVEALFIRKIDDVAIVLLPQTIGNVLAFMDSFVTLLFSQKLDTSLDITLHGQVHPHDVLHGSSGDIFVPGKLVDGGIWIDRHGTADAICRGVSVAGVRPARTGVARVVVPAILAVENPSDNRPAHAEGHGNVGRSLTGINTGYGVLANLLHLFL